MLLCIEARTKIVNDKRLQCKFGMNLLRNSHSMISSGLALAVVGCAANRREFPINNWNEMSYWIAFARALRKIRTYFIRDIRINLIWKCTWVHISCISFWANASGSTFHRIQDAKYQMEIHPFGPHSLLRFDEREENKKKLMPPSNNNKCVQCSQAAGGPDAHIQANQCNRSGQYLNEHILP